MADTQSMIAPSEVELIDTSRMMRPPRVVADR